MSCRRLEMSAQEHCCVYPAGYDPRRLLRRQDAPRPKVCTRAAPCARVREGKLGPEMVCEVVMLLLLSWAELRIPGLQRCHLMAVRRSPSGRS